MGKKTTPPLYVQVGNGEYRTFGDPTRKNRKRAKMLDRIGINSSVKNGWYTFDYRRSWKGIIVDLSLVKETRRRR